MVSVYWRPKRNLLRHEKITKPEKKKGLSLIAISALVIIMLKNSASHYKSFNNFEKHFTKFLHPENIFRTKRDQYLRKVIQRKQNTVKEFILP